MVQSDKELLVEMGFDPKRASLALKSAGGLQDALTWLEKYQNYSTDNLEIADTQNAGSSSDSRLQQEEDEQAEEPGAAASLKCSDCGKLFSTQNRAEFHASRTQHQNFEESTDIIRPLSEEEKAAKLMELKEKLAAKREAQKIIEKEEEKKNELIRRKKATDSEKIKEGLRNKERFKEVEKRKQEKIEDAKAKERVRQQIRETQEARRQQAKRDKVTREDAGVMDQGSKTTKTTREITPRVHLESRMQFRFPSGLPLVKVIPVETTLFEVASIIDAERGFTPSSFTMTFPRKVFQSGTADFGLTLKEAGMVPSCSLLVN